MFAEFLLTNYKKFHKESFHEMLLKPDTNYIESFAFPASFDGQQYSLDDIEYSIAPFEAGPRTMATGVL